MTIAQVDIYEGLSPADAEWLRSILENPDAERVWIESHTDRLMLAYQTRIDYMDGKATHEELANAYKAVGEVGRQMGLIHRAYGIAKKKAERPPDSEQG